MNLLLSVHRSALVVIKVSLHSPMGWVPEGLSVALWVSRLQHRASANLAAVKSPAPSPADCSQPLLCTHPQPLPLEWSTLRPFSLATCWTVPFYICTILILI